MDIYGLKNRKKIIHKEKKKERKGGEKGKRFFLLSPVITGAGRHLYSTRRKC